MLVSDKYKFIVACPTKTGTNSLRAVVERWRRQGGDEFTLTLLTGEKRTRHRLAPPPGKEDYMRACLYRPDESRIVSMYEYLRRKEWEWAAKDILGWEQAYGRKAAWVGFLRLILTIRETRGYFDGGQRHLHGSRPYMWTDMMDECEDYLSGLDVDGSVLPWGEQPVVRLETKDIGDDWAHFQDRMDVEEDALYEMGVTQRSASPRGGRLWDTVDAYWDDDRHYGASSILELIREAGE